ncbi:XRE family transcriptional regulator [Streptomyces sp. NPDC086838]|uniref:XRE family transcriptional regulator n=1 Tax=Streptomyces sp. NPDC086838 TaxID=3365762 RepID=UPI0038281E89
MVEQQQRTQLNDLVRTRRAELGISLRTLETRAIDPETGTQAKFGWISKLERNQPTDVPSEELIHALAVGLALPVRVVQEAVAAQYLGMKEIRTRSQAARILVARVEEMSEDDLQQLAAIAETFERSRRPSDRDGNS